MKTLKNALILSLSLGSTLAYAGDPYVNNVIKSLRDRFESGTAPTREELAGKAYQCETWPVSPTERKFLHEWTIRSFDQYLITNNRTFTNIGREWLATGNYREPITFEAYRRDNRGNLIIEHGSVKTPSKTRPLSRAPEGTWVDYYSDCTPKQ